MVFSSKFIVTKGLAYWFAIFECKVNLPKPRLTLAILFDIVHAADITKFTAFGSKAHNYLFYPRQPFLPDFVKLNRGPDVAQTVLGNFAEFLFGQQRAHVHAGNAVALG